MAKKIALLVTLVMMFTISCVFAANVPSADTASISAETSISGEEAVETASGEEAAEPTTSGEVADTTSGDVEDTHEEENGNGAVVGAIIAVVIVVAIVAIVWVLNKK